MEKAGKSEMEKLHQQLGQVSLRLRLVRMISGAGYGGLAGLAFILLWLSAGRLWPIHYLYLYAGISCLLCVIAGALWELLRPVTPKLAARIMDQQDEGVERQDAMVTALSFAEADSYAARLQREQAASYGHAYVLELKRHLPIPRPRRRLLIAACCTALAAAVLILAPNPMDQVLERERQQQAWIDSRLEEIDKNLEELDAQELDPLVKAPLREELIKLREELASAQQPEEALRSLEESMKQLQEMAERQELTQQERLDWLDAWKQQPELEGIARALEQKEAGKISEELDKLKQKLPELSDEAKDRLAEALSQLADNMPQEGEAAKQLAEALRKAAESIGEGQKSASDLALSELAAALEEELKSASEEGLQAAATAALASELAEQGLELASEMAAAGLSVSDTWAMGGSAEQLASAGGGGDNPGGESGEAGHGEGNVAGEEQGTGQGQGNGQGQGAGQGQGQGQGSGQGSGSGSGQGSGQGGTGIGQGQGSGAGFGSGGRALVTTPRDSAGSGNVEIDSGPTSGGNVQKGGQGPVFDGASRPYEEVYSDYAAEAKRALNRGELPQSLQGLVESYFTEIDPGN